ncbi:MAG: hypothetical protein WB492_04660 [Christiangramia sp.]
MHLKTLYTGLLLLLIFKIGAAQGNNEIYSSFDETVGLKNTILYNGILYMDDEKTINENNKFIFSPNKFLPGSVVYFGQYFPEVQLRFNAYNDRLLVKITDKEGTLSFELIQNEIQEFNINGHFFTKVPPSVKIERDGFFELIATIDEATILKKYKKRKKRKLTNNYVYFEFYPDTPEYYLIKENNSYSLNSTRDLIDVFPGSRKEIKEIFKMNKKVKETNPDEFAILLGKKISRFPKTKS